MGCLKTTIHIILIDLEIKIRGSDLNLIEIYINFVKKVKYYKKY